MLYSRHAGPETTPVSDCYQLSLVGSFHRCNQLRQILSLSPSSFFVGSTPKIQFSHWLFDDLYNNYRALPSSAVMSGELELHFSNRSLTFRVSGGCHHAELQFNSSMSMSVSFSDQQKTTKCSLMTSYVISTSTGTVDDWLCVTFDCVSFQPPCMLSIHNNMHEFVRLLLADPESL